MRLELDFIYDEVFVYKAYFKDSNSVKYYSLEYLQFKSVIEREMNFSVLGISYILEKGSSGIFLLIPFITDFSEVF